jgi:type IV secretion system protein VirD4
LAGAPYADRPAARPNDWGDAVITAPEPTAAEGGRASELREGGIRQEPELPEHEDVASTPAPAHEFELIEDEPDDEAVRQRALTRMQQQVNRAAAMDRDDELGMEM